MVESIVYICDTNGDISIHFGRLYVAKWKHSTSAITLKIGVHPIQFIFSFSNAISCSVNSVRGEAFWLRYLIMGYYLLRSIIGRMLGIYIFSSGRCCESGAMAKIRPYFRKLEKSPRREELDYPIHVAPRWIS